MGDRRQSLEAALCEIGKLRDTILEEVSDVIETKAEGFDGNDFLNACCRIETGLDPHSLLRELKAIEASFGRETRPARYDENGARVYSDRPIDIDILLYGDERIDTVELTIPHPRMYERDFVMIPLRQILKK